MSAGMEIFRFESSDVRVQHGNDGEPLFNVNDVCAVLGYANSRDAIAKHVDEEDVAKRDILTDGGRQRASFINESGLYALVFGSHIEGAKKFKRWVTNEVLPAIRKTGTYTTKPVDASALMKAKAYALNATVRASAAFMAHVRSIGDLTKLDNGVMASMEAVAAEMIVGRELPALKSGTADEWHSPTQIANRIGISPQRVGLAITELGIRGNVDGVARAVLNKAAHSDKTVTSYQYSDDAVRRIEAKLAESAQ